MACKASARRSVNKVGIRLAHRFRDVAPRQTASPQIRARPLGSRHSHHGSVRQVVLNAWGRANRAEASTSPSTAVQQQIAPPSVFESVKANPSLVSQLVLAVSLIACSLSVAIAALMCSLIPAIKSMKQAAIEIALLARCLREEAPDTLAALRLSGVEISDCVEEIGELSNDLTRGIRTSARTIAATSGVVKDGAYYVKDNVYPAVKEHVVPAATSTMKTVLKKRADLNNYDKPVIAMAASRTARVIKGLRSIMLARELTSAVGGSGGTPSQMPPPPQEPLASSSKPEDSKEEDN